MMTSNASASAVLPTHEELPPYSAVAPQTNQPRRRYVPSDNAASMADRTLPPRYEHPPNYSKIPKNYHRTLPPRGELRSPSIPLSEPVNTQLPGGTATQCRVSQLLDSLHTARRETLDAHAHDIAALWTVGDGHPVRTYCKPMFQRIFGHEPGRKIWEDLDSCLENEVQCYAANARLAILGS